MVTRPQTYVDPQPASSSHRSVPQYADLKGYSLTPRFVFIDGRTGTELYSETYHEEALYPTGQNTPALVLLLRADGQAPAELPQHAEHAENPRARRTLLK